MILVGLTGGMLQGKSTVGRRLRELADVGSECDLETSYVITDVLNAWLKHWPAIVKLEPGKDVIDLANNLINSLPDELQKVVHKTASADLLQIQRTHESQQLHYSILEYLELRLGAGPKQPELFSTPITVENKETHRKLFSWMGACMVELIDEQIWNDAHDRRIKELEAAGAKFVTVGGIRYKSDAEMIRRNDGLILKVSRPGVATSNDATELAMAEVVPDVEVVNNGTMEQLEDIIQKVYADLVAGKLKPANGEPMSYVADLA